MNQQPRVPEQPVDDPVLELVRRMLLAGGRLSEQEVRKLAEEIGVVERRLERLWTEDPKLLDSEGDHRVVTSAGRRRLNNIR
jgi:hypothetical protein